MNKSECILTMGGVVRLVGWHKREPDAYRHIRSTRQENMKIQTFDEWWNAHGAQYSADACHMSEYHMAHVVWEAAQACCAVENNPELKSILIESDCIINGVSVKAGTLFHVTTAER